MAPVTEEQIAQYQRILHATRTREYVLSGMGRKKLEGLTVRMRRTIIPTGSSDFISGGGSSMRRGSLFDRRIRHIINCEYGGNSGARNGKGKPCECSERDKIPTRIIDQYMKDVIKTMGFKPLASQVLVWSAKKGIKTWIDDVFIGQDAHGPFSVIVERKTGYSSFVTRNLCAREGLFEGIEYTHLNSAALQSIYGARMYQKCYPELPPVRCMLVCYFDNRLVNSLTAQLDGTRLTWIDVNRLGWFTGQRLVDKLWSALSHFRPSSETLTNARTRGKQSTKRSGFRRWRRRSHRRGRV